MATKGQRNHTDYEAGNRLKNPADPVLSFVARQATRKKEECAIFREHGKAGVLQL